MNTFPSIDRNIPLRHRLTDDALNDTEAFRQHATETLRHFIPRERQLMQRLVGIQPDAWAIFDRWNDELKEDRAAILLARDDRAFQTSLKKNLLLTDNQVSVTAEKLITDRDTQLVERFIHTLFPEHSKKTVIAQKTISQLLRYKEAHIISLFDHYAQAVITRDVAREHHVTIIDPHARWWKRVSAKRHIRRERRQRLRQETRQLRRLHQSTVHIKKHPLVDDLSRLPIEFVVISAAKTRFDKAVAKKIAPLEDAAPQSTVLFEDSMKPLRTEYLSRLKKNTSAEAAQEQLVSFNQLMWRVFRLSQTEINHIMVALKQLRENDEQRTIIQTERNPGSC